MTAAGFSWARAKALLRAKQYGALREELSRAETDRVAAGWGEGTSFERIVLFKLLPAAHAEEVFGKLPAEQKLFVLATLPAGCLGPVLEDLGRSDAEELFRCLPEATVRRLRQKFLQEG